MNKRILELAEQAGLHDFVFEAMGIGEEFEKFAELIVRECVSVVDGLEGSDYIPWVNTAIKKHFGVES